MKAKIDVTIPQIGLERRLAYELQTVATNLSKRIMEDRKGTATDKEALVSKVAAMCNALQNAVAAGGREAYDTELDRWKGHEFFEEFVQSVDSAMTRMPLPRNRPVTRS
jgi:hypothetical protein